MKRRLWMSVAAAGVLLAGAACSGNGKDIEPPGADKSLKPPIRFDTSAAVALPPEATDTNTALHQANAFINTPIGVIVFDTATAKTLGVVSTKHPTEATPDAGKLYRPISGTVGGKAVMLVVIPVTVADQATPADSQLIDVLLIDATSGTLIRTVTTQVKRPKPDGRAARAVAIVDGELILNNIGTTSRISLADGTVRWTSSSFETKLVAGDNGSRLIGATAINSEAHLRAIDSATGQTVWTDPDGAGLSIGINPGGPRYIVASSQNFTKVIEVDSGTTTATGDAALGKELRCFYDQQTTTVCSVPGKWTSALDATSGQWIWQLPDTTSRTTITVTAAFHGHAYGTSANGAVVLDARTGHDLEPNAGAAPILVNEYSSVGKANGGLTAYPTRP